MAFADLYYEQTGTSLGDDPFGDAKTAGCILTVESVRINPGLKTIVFSLGIYNSVTDYKAGERPIWRTGISINENEYDPNGDTDWTTKEWKPSYDLMRANMQVINDTDVIKVQIQDSPDVEAWILLHDAPNNPANPLSTYFQDSVGIP